MGGGVVVWLWGVVQKEKAMEKPNAAKKEARGFKRGEDIPTMGEDLPPEGGKGGVGT